MHAARIWNILALTVFALSLGCVGCGAAGQEPTPAADLGQELAAPTAAEPAKCEVVFSPEADIADLVESAAEQWSEATGCDVHLGQGGIPVRFVERITNEAGQPQCGVTHRLRADTGEILGASDIEISTNRADRCHLTARDVLHETGHGLAPRRGHTSEGLMAAVPNGVDYVDDVSRAFICGELGC